MSSEMKHRYRYLVDRSLGFIINSSMVITVVYIIGYSYMKVK
jgi:hypothetical protein